MAQWIHKWGDRSPGCKVWTSDVYPEHAIWEVPGMAIGYYVVITQGVVTGVCPSFRGAESQVFADYKRMHPDADEDSRIA